MPKHHIIQLCRTLPSFLTSALAALFGYAVIKSNVAAARALGLGYNKLGFHQVTASITSWAGFWAFMFSRSVAYLSCGAFVLMMTTMWAEHATKKPVGRLYLFMIVYGILGDCLRTLNMRTVCLGAPDDDCGEFVGQNCFDTTLIVLREVVVVRAWVAMYRELKNDAWVWILPIYYLAVIMSFGALAQALIPLTSAADGIKFVFAVAINPFVCELQGVLARVTARCARHNHPSTSWGPICLMVMFKKLGARFVISTVRSSILVTMMSIFSGLVELAGRTTMPIRDGFMYRRIFGAYLPSEMNPVALMTNVRSRGLRAETESLEAITDVVYVINNCAWALLFNVSLNGKSPPDGLILLRAALIQISIETFIDIACCLYMATVQNYHLQTNSEVKCKGWEWLVAIYIFCFALWLFAIIPFLVLCTHEDLPRGVDFGISSQFY